MNGFLHSMDGSVATFTIQGDFTQHTASGMRQALLETIRNGVTTVKVDLEKTNHIDSTSIGLLVAAYNTLCKTSGELIVTRAKPPIAELFSVLQLDKRFKVTTK